MKVLIPAVVLEEQEKTLLVRLDTGFGDPALRVLAEKVRPDLQEDGEVLCPHCDRGQSYEGPPLEGQQRINVLCRFCDKKFVVTRRLLVRLVAEAVA